MATNDLFLNIAAFTIQVALIVAAATALLSVIRIGSPGVRYACWRFVLITCLVLPWVLRSTAAPVRQLPPQYVSHVESPDTPSGSDIVTGPEPGHVVTGSSITRDGLAFLVIVAGAVVRGAWLGIGLLRLRRMRRHGQSVDDAVYLEIQRTLGTAASIKSVAGLTQPATCGFRHPVVLLPDTLGESAVDLRRAVVTHELFHVQRRDWLWVLGEEALRGLFWFHPAIFWLTSRIQLAREELVDELTVLATGNRKAYIEALLAFADAGRVRPAPAFARRRHLFTRIVRLSKESVMSSPRIVLSATIAIATVLVSAWYASHAFPIVFAATPPAVVTGPATREQASAPIVDAPIVVATPRAGQGPRSGGAPRPGPAPVAAPQGGTKSITPENPIPRRLSSVPVYYPAQLKGSGYRGSIVARVTLDASGRISDVQRLAADAVGDGAGVDRAVATAAFFDATADAVKQWRYQSPADPPIAFFVNVRFDGEKEAVTAQSEAPAAPARFVPSPGFAPAATAAIQSLQNQLENANAARQLALQRLSPDNPDVQRLNAQISGLESALESAKAANAAAGTPATRVAGPGAATGQPVRVGGNIKPPTKTKHVNPEYPEIAKSARVQGVVILEVVIDENGRVAEARVLRSIPLLDQAALDAVRQWEFSPTLLNGAPVPVIMTVTVQFTLPPPPQ